MKPIIDSYCKEVNIIYITVNIHNENTLTLITIDL